MGSGATVDGASTWGFAASDEFVGKVTHPVKANPPASMADMHTSTDLLNWVARG